MRIVITGASGFLGGHLARRFAADGHEVVAPVRVGGGAAPSAPGVVAPTIRPIESMSIEDWSAILVGADAVVHAAAIAHIGPSVPDQVYEAVNRDASARLAQAAALAGVRHFIFISSIRAQVGPTSAEVQSEASPAAPTEAYGLSKLQAEAMVLEALPRAVILRPALIVGCEAKGNLATLLKVARSPWPLPLAGLTRGNAMVSLDSLADVVSLAFSAAAMAGQTYIVADRRQPSLAEVVGWMREGMGRPPALFSIPQSCLTVPLRLAGRAAAADRLSGGLLADASKLAAAGWTPRDELAATFRAMGAAG